jgi:SAM-dependent methyltransferase
MSTEIIVMSEVEARHLVDQINATADRLADLAIEAYARRAWLSLGYASWDAFTAAEIQLPKLGRDERRELVASLRSAGMSTRAIGSAIGVAPKTVRRDLAGGAFAPPEKPDKVVGADGKTYEPTRPTPTRAAPGELDAIEETLEEAEIVPTPEAIEEALDEIEESQRTPSGPPTKPDLGDGISHPARYSAGLLPIFAGIIDYNLEYYMLGHLVSAGKILDPFAGTGRIHDLRDLIGCETVGVELEAEWADLHADTICGNALHLPFEDHEFDVICTSPTYGNRLADSHNASDPERRRSYTHDLGRKLHDDNSGAMQWSLEYREFHLKAWVEAVRVLRPGGLFILNIKDHIREGIQQPVSTWHAATLVSLGLDYDPELSQGVPTRHLRQGSTRERAGQELVLVFKRPNE